MNATLRTEIERYQFSQQEIVNVIEYVMGIMQARDYSECEKILSALVIKIKPQKSGTPKRQNSNSTSFPPILPTSSKSYFDFTTPLYHDSTNHNAQNTEKVSVAVQTEFKERNYYNLDYKLRGAAQFLATTKKF